MTDAVSYSMVVAVPPADHLHKMVNDSDRSHNGTAWEICPVALDTFMGFLTMNNGVFAFEHMPPLLA
jgi:hypothetical protein